MKIRLTINEGELYKNMFYNLLDDFNVESSIYMRAHSEEEILKEADCERSQKTYPSQVNELIL